VNRLSVIIPTYQHAATIVECLNSVFAQTRVPDEVIVVNDGSTDGTEKLLERFRQRLSIITQENQGGNVARNNGCLASNGNLVIFCDADVVLHPDALEKMEQALVANPEASVAYAGFRFGWKSFRSFPFDPGRLRQMNYIHTTSLVRREHFPGFDPSIRRFQDWDVWLTMLEQGRIGTFIDEELFRVINLDHRPAISQWRPSFLYKIPWKHFGWCPDSIQKYEEARRVISRKHGL